MRRSRSRLISGLILMMISRRPARSRGDVIAKDISVMGDPMSGEELAAMMLG